MRVSRKSQGRRTASPNVLRRLGSTIGLIGALLLAVALPVEAQSEGTPDQVVIFIIDLSGSMNEPLDGELTKLDVAKEGFVEAFDRLNETAEVGLQVYGSGADSTAPASRESNCLTDTQTIQPVGPLEREMLISQVQGLEARGDTLIAKSLEDAAEAVPADAFATVVLFSDGRDECFDADLDGNPGEGPSWGNDPCDVARRLAGQGIDLRIDNIAADIQERIDRVHTVGFLPDAAAESELRCIAEETGGSFTNISTLQEARDELPDLLIDLGSPPEVEPPGGLPLDAGASQATAAQLPRLQDEAKGRFVDDIEMGSERWYEVGSYGPGEGTFTATVFGLPAEEGITFGLRMQIPETDQTLFTNQGTDNAGLPRSGSRSIRCPGCTISGADTEVYWVVSLSSVNENLTGTYELELLVEGTAFGGLPTNCQEPQECWYEGEIAARTTQLEGVRAEIDEQLANSGAAPLLAERDALDDEVASIETDLDLASAKQQDLEMQLELLGGPSTNFALPLLLAGGGLIPAVAGIVLMRRRPDESATAIDGSIVDDRPPPVDDAAVIGRVVSAGPSQQSPSPQPAGPSAQDLAAYAPPTQPSKAGSNEPDWLGASQLAGGEVAGPTRPGHPPHSPAAGGDAPETLPQGHSADYRPAPETVTAAEPTLPASEETVAAAEPTVAAAEETLAAAEQTIAASGEAHATPERTVPAAGWYQDPQDPTRYRWWDGARWGQQAPSGEGE